MTNPDKRFVPFAAAVVATATLAAVAIAPSATVHAQTGPIPTTNTVPRFAPARIEPVEITRLPFAPAPVMPASIAPASIAPASIAPASIALTASTSQRFAAPQLSPAQIEPVPSEPVPSEPVPLPPPREPVGREPIGSESARGPFMPEERPIKSLSAAIRPIANQLPPDFAEAHFRSPASHGDGRPWHDTLYFWEPPALCHRPLYFEEANLERYGYGLPPVFQPVVSGTRFLATTAALPYLMTAQSPRDCVYTLGRDRPGSLAPRRPHYPELRPAAGAAEVGAAAGLILLIP
jgi:hypothetical protein